MFIPFLNGCLAVFRRGCAVFRGEAFAGYQGNRSRVLAGLIAAKVGGETFAGSHFPRALCSCAGRGFIRELRGNRSRVRLTGKGLSPRPARLASLASLAPHSAAVRRSKRGGSVRGFDDAGNCAPGCWSMASTSAFWCRLIGRQWPTIAFPSADLERGRSVSGEPMREGRGIVRRFRFLGLEMEGKRSRVRRKRGGIVRE